MSIIRSDKEVALNDLLVATRETIDHYRDAAEFLEDKNVTDVFIGIVSGREPLVSQLENAVRALGDLPSVPDPDKETGAMLIHHASAMLTDDYIPKVIEQRLQAEQQLAELVNAGRAAGLEDYCGALINQIDEQVEQTIKQLLELRGDIHN